MRILQRSANLQGKQRSKAWNGSRCINIMYGNCWVPAWTTDWAAGERTRSALGAQVKAIQLCDQEGWSLAAPLRPHLRADFSVWRPCKQMSRGCLKFAQLCCSARGGGSRFTSACSMAHSRGRGSSTCDGAWQQCYYCSGLDLQLHILVVSLLRCAQNFIFFAPNLAEK